MLKGKVLTLDEVTSTQDAAIEHHLQVGDVCRSFNQTAGRGRRGNEWDSSGGVAVTVVVQRATPYLPLAVAATLATALNSLIPHSKVGIKWPNDLYVEGKKLAGVLIEQRDGQCLVGVGVNVLSSPLRSAVALNQLGSEPTVERVADLVATSVFDATQFDENKAVTSWSERDILVGTTQRIQTGNDTVEGLVLEIDPCHALILQTATSIIECPAATSTVVTHCQ